MFYVIIEKVTFEKLVNDEFIQQEKFIVRQNVPEFDPIFPNMSIEQRFDESIRKNMIPSEVEIPIGYWYVDGKFVEPEPLPPEPIYPSDIDILTDILNILLGGE